MATIHIDCDEAYPSYSVTDTKIGLAVEVTDEELAWIKRREKQADELHRFLAEKYKEADRVRPSS